MTSVGVPPAPDDGWPAMQNQSGMISMTAVWRAARALKRISDEQVLMWEGFWRASRFPAGHADGAGRAR